MSPKAPPVSIRSATRRSMAHRSSAGTRSNRYFSGSIQQNAPGYLPELLARGERRGQLQPWEAEDWGSGKRTARAMPTRDIGSLTAGWQGDIRMSGRHRTGGHGSILGALTLARSCSHSRQDAGRHGDPAGAGALRPGAQHGDRLGLPRQCPAGERRERLRARQ